jgi:catechol 2,3-dioxygenase-like lactoylglutathione lyase family enzyme
MRFTVDDLPYHAVADDRRVHAIERGYFEVDGFARVHALNDVLTPELSDVELKGLAGDATLKDAKLRIVVPTGYQKATSAEHAFVFDAEDPRFAQASAFAHGQQHRLWFESLGVEWRGSLPLEIKLHVKPGGRANNALYVPDDENTAATISIDDGDGVELQKLALDSDVISHELGHHVVFETLKKTDGEALVLHEGLADFFLFARADDPCLGESICPEGSNACILEAQCLRSGELELRFGDDNWKAWAGSLNRLGHLHSQVISGMLWDVRREDLMSVTDLAKLVLRAVSLLSEDSGFADFLAALVAADEELHAGQHVARLESAAAARGLESFLTGGTLGSGTAADSETPATGGSTPAAGATTGTATQTATATGTSTATTATGGSSDKDKRLPFCGVAGNADGQHSAAMLLVMLAVLAPALWPARTPPSRVRAWLSAPERRWRPRSTRRRPPL